MDVYPDFRTWTADQGPYRHTNTSQDLEGGHAMLIVGYDDDEQAYIVKNSWGTGPGQGEQGYWTIGCVNENLYRRVVSSANQARYGEANIDDLEYNKYGVTNIDPDQYARRPHRNGAIYQSSLGKTHRDLVVSRTDSQGNVLVLQREGEGKKTWNVTGYLNVTIDNGGGEGWSATNKSAWGQPIILETSFGRQREMVYWAPESNLVAHWVYTGEQNRQKPPPYDVPKWYQLPPAGVVGKKPRDAYGVATGYPGFVQLDSSDFSIVVRTRNGALTEVS